MVKKKYPESQFDEQEFYIRDAKRLHDKLKRQIEDSEEIKGESTQKYLKGIIQWMINGGQFTPIGDIQLVKQLPSGWYHFVWNGKMTVPELMTVRSDELIKLPMPEYDAVLDDLQRFWSSEELYRKHNFPYKRGIILYGRPGTGKSGLLRVLADDLIKKHNGVLFNIGNPDDIHSFESIFGAFREIEPTRKAFCILEDVDNFMRYGGSTQAKLLNILDGNMHYDNIVFLATTNFPQVLLESISNRPSRFDRRYEIGTPNAEARGVYISNKFKELSSMEVEKLVSATDGFSIDQLKETILSIYVLGYPFEQVIGDMKKLFTYNGRVGDGTDRFRGDSDDYASGSNGMKNIVDARTEFNDELNR